MNPYPRVPLNTVLTLDRDAVRVDPSATYHMVGVRSFGRGLFPRPPIQGAATTYAHFFRLRTEQVVLSRLFGWEGAVALVPPEFEGWFVSSEFPTFTVDLERALPSFIGHVMRSSRFHDQLAGATRGLGQRRQRVHVQEFLDLEIPLPAMEEQRRLAQSLDALSGAVSALTQRAPRVSALTEAFVVSASTRPDLDEQAKIRAGWRQLSLSDILEQSVNNVQVEPTGRYRIAGIYSFGRGLIKRKEISGAETSYKALTCLRDGDIVISKLGAWEGAVAVVDPKFDGYCVSSEFPTFKITGGQCLPEFFRGLARSPAFWEKLDLSTRGSMARRKRITPAEFLRVQIWLPPMETQVQVAAWLDAVDRVASVRDRHKALAEALIPAAMNEVFAGLS